MKLIKNELQQKIIYKTNNAVDDCVLIIPFTYVPVNLLFNIKTKAKDFMISKIDDSETKTQNIFSVINSLINDEN